MKWGMQIFRKRYRMAEEAGDEELIEKISEVM